MDRIKENGDPVLNSRFVDFANHYGFEIRPCKPYKARTKGKVERPIRYLKENFMVRKTTVFDSVDKANGLVRHWTDNVANKRVHGTTHEIPDDRFERERDKLGPIHCVTPFDVAIYEDRKVGRDCYVCYQTNRYSVPPKYAGKLVTLRITPSTLFVLSENRVITEHPLIRGRYKVIVKQEHLEELKLLRRPTELPRQKRLEVSLRTIPEVEVRPLSTYEKFATGGGQ